MSQYNVNCYSFCTAHLSVMYVSVLQSLLFNTLLIKVLHHISPTAFTIYVENQVWEEPYLSTCIFIICDGAMDRYLKENYLIPKHNGEFSIK